MFKNGNINAYQSIVKDKSTKEFASSTFVSNEGFSPTGMLRWWKSFRSPRRSSRRKRDFSPSWSLLPPTARLKDNYDGFFVGEKKANHHWPTSKLSDLMAREKILEFPPLCPRKNRGGLNHEGQLPKSALLSLQQWNGYAVDLETITSLWPCKYLRQNPNWIWLE